MKTACYVGILLALAGTAAALAPSADFDRYRIILDRNPFGLPGGVQSSVISTNQADTFAKNLRISALLDLPVGPRVGLISTAATNQSYFLSVGEKSEDGIELVSINYGAEEAVLRKGAEEVVLRLSTPTTNATATLQAASAPPSSDPFAERRAYWERRRSDRGSHDAGGGPPRQSADHLQHMQQRLQDYQMRAIRSGQPPLPVPLSPEADAQLVKEGLLPPQR